MTSYCASYHRYAQVYLFSTLNIFVFNWILNNFIARAINRKKKNICIYFTSYCMCIRLQSTLHKTFWYTCLIGLWQCYFLPSSLYSWGCEQLLTVDSGFLYSASMILVWFLNSLPNSAWDPFSFMWDSLKQSFQNRFGSELGKSQMTPLLLARSIIIITQVFLWG